MPIGAMIEVPAAAICIDDIMDEVDFISVGTNDLIQYLMAADRDNPKVAHLCEPFSPAIFRIIKQIITACVRRNKPITVCGEMAGRPRCVLPLFAMGLRSFSMSPAFVPTVKQVIRSIDCKIRARDSRFGAADAHDHRDQDVSHAITSTTLPRRSFLRHVRVKDERLPAGIYF